MSTLSKPRWSRIRKFFRPLLKTESHTEFVMRRTEEVFHEAPPQSGVSGAFHPDGSITITFLFLNHDRMTVDVKAAELILTAQLYAGDEERFTVALLNEIIRVTEKHTHTRGPVSDWEHQGHKFGVKQVLYGWLRDYYWMQRRQRMQEENSKGGS